MTSKDDLDAELTPPTVTDEEQFVVALRRIRERSGLTFKGIERRAAAEGPIPLPASTLATALNRRTVPRPEVVDALVRVCGGSPEIVKQWLDLRETLLHPLPESAELPASEDSAPHGRPVPWWASRRSWYVTGGVVVLAGVAALIVAVWPSGHQAPSRSVPGSGPAPATPAAGADVLKIGGLCLSEHDHDSTGRIYLSTCARSSPPRRLRSYATGLWRVATDHPQYGPGCMGVVSGSTAVGAALSDDTCDRIQTDRFTLTSVTGGYLLLPEGHDLCVGVSGIPRVDAPVLQLTCDTNAAGQVFTVERR